VPTGRDCESLCNTVPRTQLLSTFHICIDFFADPAGPLLILVGVPGSQLSQ